MNAKKTDTPFMRSRRALILDHCFYASLIMHLNEVEDSDAKRGVWADGKSIGFNPESMEQIVEKSLNAGAGLLAKSSLACALGHHVRRGNRNRDLWQQASDGVVNPEIRASGLELPEGAFFDERLRGLSVEQAYEVLEGDQQQQQQQQKQEQQQSQQQQDEQGSDEDDGSEKDEQQQQQGAGDAPGEAEGEGEGEGEPQSQTGEVRDLPSDEEDGNIASEAEREEQAREWKITLQQALQTAQSRGELPGHLKALIEQALAPQVSWREELRKFMQSLSFDESTWSVPNRRFMSLGITLPTVRSNRMGSIVIGNDTSGSTSGAQAAFLGEIKAIIEDTQPKRALHLQCDTRVCFEEELEAGDELTEATHGHGGTDLRKLFERVELEEEQPACMIVLTDLETPFPDVEPPYPVLWVNVNKHGAAPFGEVIHIDVSQR